ncbi:hypothetical protein SDRG_14178 [Saprolegnia diclina VS20]|uniref:Alpha-type protein kinase domain-containing protein n=1 Tax=Saprolegnia diclina (strain VS20) TaxID=1156394 RepID=T0Q3T7_SAPDV|nr:hypothetical protein SDRG_14178 [Saprolegnia diclina VS20]EQC28085.1 hypothetical protein SDRG_14178 [Saprolegnia diclina VS20]|eukprot:XP_008618510.1 hypothetical protein SDRG_14178 [Saprolegnia diclina VS20]
MTRFFATHECNALCTALGLPPFDGPDPMAAPLPLAPSEDEMRCSCWLCGATYTRTHAAVVAELKANDGCDVHCDACTALITATTSTVACSTCNRPVTFAAYRCEMEGEAPPTLCMGCTPPTLPTTWIKRIHAAVETAAQADGWATLAAVEHHLVTAHPEALEMHRRGLVGPDNSTLKEKLRLSLSLVRPPT